jgi:hypothetical protein
VPSFPAGTKWCPSFVNTRWRGLLLCWRGCPFDRGHADGRFRRIFLLATHPGEGRFTSRFGSSPRLA